MAYDGQRTLIAVSEGDAVVMDYGFRVVGFDGVYEEAGMYTLEAVSLVIHSAVFPDPGGGFFHLLAMGIERGYGGAFADFVPGPALGQGEFVAEKVVLVIAAEKDEVVAEGAGKTLDGVEDFPALPAAVKEVAQEDDLVILFRMHFIQEGAEFLIAPVDIADDDGSYYGTESD